MDARFSDATDDPLKLTDRLIIRGLGHVIRSGATDCDPLPFLKAPKLRKYMGVQDDLAVVTAANALRSAGLLGTPLGERAGLYLVVGYIPFEQSDIDGLLNGSVQDGTFDMRRFSTTGIRAVNGLLTFRCLPNMPAFHISVNFEIQGPYFVTYPGPGQFYIALEQACLALRAGTIDVALVGGVAHQRNFLVESHFQRLPAPVCPEQLCDAAGCLVLEREETARRRMPDAATTQEDAALPGMLIDFRLAYRAHDPLAESPAFEEQFLGIDAPANNTLGLGPASLPVLLSLQSTGPRAEPRVVEHRLSTRDGLQAQSRWRLT